ncbi:AAA family ATPase [Arthrobacter sp. MYb227]|uniref:DNA polymerase III subunit gamma and tau n=1 Tax=Arthrobacter sp. MYb227 TaxID=1848601 RepID=UPI000CFC6F93|nr:DNA polymerase III subunit gamma and tau [Arthrobacter sp. MYb227]PQZ89605.1 AAA family ATPase [Arthrobacter sp. MYb227]
MSTALYRRYRPDNFADVIGQEHVTTPLMTALEKNRVNHAYLFSGPRGCGKTTSARILARCLNCAQGPTPTPCGTCPSCVELASGGPGSLDVIEIDAASHGGVDDARDLRERATFAPVRDRYKIFIIDEAHMVTSAGFNALLKIVEEPPEHIKFIFATTEPDKVIGTIRSRTHHYPFRLVPPEPLIKYLEYLCTAEGVAVAPGVLSLVIRAGGGSVRDSLSVLDQLIAGAGPNGLDYELAVSLLGYTHASLLDDVVDALGAGDAATVFGAVDRVVQTGHDPRRFVEDLLECFRDLIIVRAVPDDAAQIIRGLPEDQLQRMQEQAAGLGQAELSRWADITNTGLTEMSGATSPRLHLELLCARLLLPASDTTERGINARLDKIERRLAGSTDSFISTGAADGDSSAPRSDASAEAQGQGAAAAREAQGQGAAAAREALRAAREQKQGGAPGASEPAVMPITEPEAEAPQAPVAAEPTPEPVHETPVPVEVPDAVEVVTPSSTAAPVAPAPSADTEHSADWGGSWGPVPDTPANPVTEPVNPAQGTPVHPPADVPPFSILPDRTPEPAEQAAAPAPAPAPAPIQQNAAMAEFTKRAMEDQALREREAQEHAFQEAEARKKVEAEQHAAREHAARQEAAAAQRAEQQAAAVQQAQQQQSSPQQAAQPAGEPQTQQAGQFQGQPQQQRFAPQHPGQQQPGHFQQQPPAMQQAPQQERPAPHQGAPTQQAQAVSSGPGSVATFQQAWPAILEEIKGVTRRLWMTLEPHASVTGFDGRTLTISVANPGALNSFASRQENIMILGQSIQKVVGVQVELAVVAGGTAPAGGSGPKVDRRPEPAVTSSPAEPAPQQHTAVPSTGAPQQPAPTRWGSTSSVTSPPISSAPAPAAQPWGTGQTQQNQQPERGASIEAPALRAPEAIPEAPTPPVLHDYAPAQSAVEATNIVVPPTAPVSEPGPYSNEDPGFGPEPSYDSDPWEDTGGDWDPDSVPVPDWEPEGGGSAQVAEPAWGTESAAPLPISTELPPIPPPATPKGYVAPAPSLGAADRPVAPPPGAPAATWGMPVTVPEPEAVPIPVAAPTSGGPLSRYQRLMNRAAGIADAPMHSPAQQMPTDPAAGAWGDPADAPDFARPRSTETPANPAVVQPTPVESDDTEFVPSDDDIEVEDSSLIGVPAIERILKGRIIEERDPQGNVIERPNRAR